MNKSKTLRFFDTNLVFGFSRLAKFGIKVTILVVKLLAKSIYRMYKYVDANLKRGYYGVE